MKIIKRFYAHISFLCLILLALTGAHYSTPMLPNVEIEFKAKDKIYNSYRPEPKIVPVPVNPELINI